MLKKIQVKNFRNIENIELDNLEQSSKNTILYSIFNGSGKTNFLKAIKKTVDSDYFSELDLPFGDNKNLSVKYTLNDFKFNDQVYDNLTIEYYVDQSMPFFTKIRFSESKSYLNKFEEDFDNSILKFYQLYSNPQFDKLFIKYFLIGNTNYSTAKRSHIALYAKNKEINVSEIFYKAIRTDSKHMVELLKPLSQSVSENTSDLLTHLIQYRYSKKFSTGVEDFERDFIRSLSDMIDIFIEWYEVENQLNLSLGVHNYLVSNFKFIEDEYVARTINILDEQNDWLDYFLKFFKLDKKILFEYLIRDEKNQLIDIQKQNLSKLVSKLEEIFNFYNKLNDQLDSRQQIEKLDIKPIEFKGRKVISIRAIMNNGNTINLEQLGSTFLEFVKLLPILLFDSANKFFLLDDFIDNYSAKTKDQILNFLSKRVKGKIIYTTNYLTDAERFGEISDLNIIDSDQKNINTLKEVALLKQLANLKEEIKNLQESRENAIANNLNSELGSTALNEEVEALNNKIDSLQKDLDEKIEEIAILKRQNEILSQEKPVTPVDNSELITEEQIKKSEQYSELIDEYNELEKEHNDLKIKFDDLEKLNQDLIKKQIERSETNIASDPSDDSELNDLIKERNDLKDELLENKTKITKIQFELDVLRKEYADLNEESINLKNLKNDLEVSNQKEYTTSQKRIEQNEQEYENLYSKVSLFETKIKKLEDVNDELYERNKSLDLQNQQLKLDLQGKIDLLEDEAIYKDNQIKLLESQIDESNRQFDELVKDLRENKKKLHLLESTIVQLNLLVDKSESSKLLLKKNYDYKEKTLIQEKGEIENDLRLLNSDYEDIKNKLSEINIQHNELQLDYEKALYEISQNNINLERIDNDFKAKNKKYLDEIEKLTKSNEELNDKILSTEKDLLAASIEVKSLEKIIEHKDEQYEQEVKLLSGENEVLKSKDEENKTKLNKLEGDYKSKEVELDRVKKDFEVQLDSSDKKIEDLSTKLDELMEKNKLLDETKSNLIFSNNDLEKKVELLNQQITTKDERITKLEEKRLELRDKSEIDKKDFNEKISTLREENSTLKVNGLSTKNELEDLRKDFDLISKENTYLNEQNEKLLKQIEANDDEETRTILKYQDRLVEADVANNDLFNSKNKNERLAKDLDESKAKIQELREQLKEIRVEKKQIATDLVLLQKQNTTFKDINDEYQKQILELENELKNVPENVVVESNTDELEVYQAQIIEAQSKADKAERELNKQKAQLEKLEKQVKDKETEVKNLKAKNADLNKKVTTVADKKPVVKETTKTVIPKDYEEIKESLKVTTQELEDLKLQLTKEKENAKKATTQSKTVVQKDTKLEKDNKLNQEQINNLTKLNEDLKQKLSRTEKLLQQREEVLKLNNLSETFEQSHYEKERLILSSSPSSVAFIQWLVEKEKILLSEFVYEFIVIPTTKKEIEATMQLINKKDFEQLFFFVDYTNESKKVYNSQTFKDVRSKYKISQLKPYYWNMKRNTSTILNEQIVQKDLLSFRDIIFKTLNRAKIKYDKENEVAALNILVAKLEGDEEAYKKFLKTNNLDKLIKLLKSN